MVERVLERPTEIWSSQLGIDQLARTVIGCLDEVAQTYDESGCQASGANASLGPNSKPSDAYGRPAAAAMTHSPQKLAARVE
ncbi:hypothetical protein [Streptomyces sparsus]